jgi:hypothetical protein
LAPILLSLEVPTMSIDAERRPESERKGFEVVLAAEQPKLQGETLWYRR